MSLQQFVNYRKLGGVLMAIFVISIIGLILIAISFISIWLTKDALMQVSSFFTPEYFLFTLSTSFINFITSLAFVILLSKRNRTFIYVYIFSVAIGLILTVTSYILFSSIMTLTNNSLLTNIATIVLNIAIIVYFFKSARVKVYCMSTPEYNQEYMRMRQIWEQHNMQAQAAYAQQGYPYGQQPPASPQQGNSFPQPPNQ